MDMFLVCAVDPVAPCTRLTVQVVPVGEGPSRQEVSLDKVEGAFYPPRTIRVADLVRHKLESETTGKRSHLGHGNHFPARTAQDNDVGVVDHHPLRRAAEVAMGVGQKRFTVEPLKPREELEKEHARITQDGRGRLHVAPLAAKHGLVRRGVMLHLLAGRKGILACRFLFDLTDAVAAAEGRQRLIGQFRSLGEQFLMDPNQIAVAGSIQLQEPLPVRFRSFRTQDRRDFG